MAKNGKGKPSRDGDTKEIPPSAVRLPCVFGGVSIGKSTARIGVKIPRGFLNLVAADELLVEHRISCIVKLNREGVDPAQLTLLDDIEDTITGSADVKRIGVSKEHVSAGLTFSLADVDIAEMAKFSKGTGELQINGVSEIPSDAPSEEAAGSDVEE